MTRGYTLIEGKVERLSQSGTHVFVRMASQATVRIPRALIEHGDAVQPGDSTIYVADAWMKDAGLLRRTRR